MSAPASRASAPPAAALAHDGQPFTWRVRVRYNECDPVGVVFNANYLVYVDVALTELWRALIGSYAALAAEHGRELLLVESTVRYRAPARAEDELCVGVELTRLGTTSMSLAATIRRGEQPIADATLHYVFVDAAQLAKRPIPASLRPLLERHLRPAA